MLKKRLKRNQSTVIIHCSTLDAKQHASSYVINSWRKITDFKKCFSCWITRFEFNRVYYNSLQEGDRSFLTQVLFAIDQALQIYLQSCSDNEERRAINTHTLQMQDLQNIIEHHNFSYIIPKILLNKFLTDPSDPSNGNRNGRKPGKKRDKDENKKENKKNPKVKDNHKQWYIKQNENFPELFWKNSSDCQRNKKWQHHLYEVLCQSSLHQSMQQSS